MAFKFQSIYLFDKLYLSEKNSSVISNRTHLHELMIPMFSRLFRKQFQAFLWKQAWLVVERLRELRWHRRVDCLDPNSVDFTRNHQVRRRVSVHYSLAVQPVIYTDSHYFPVNILLRFPVYINFWLEAFFFVYLEN